MQYRVHEFPVNESHVDGRCALGSVGRRWNPRQIDPNTCFPAAFSKCEMGDLSGKFGQLLSNVFVAQRFIDPTLSLLGPSGIIGRSLAIYDDQGQPSVCATIVCTSGCPPSSLNSAPGAAQCSSESCPDRTMPWSSPLSGGCYATQLKDYYVKCDGKKAALQASVISGGRTISLDRTGAPAVTSVAAAPAAPCSSSSCTDGTMVWSSPLTGECFATQVKDYYVKCNGNKAGIQPVLRGTETTSHGFRCCPAPLFGLLVLCLCSTFNDQEQSQAGTATDPHLCGPAKANDRIECVAETQRMNEPQA